LNPQKGELSALIPPYAFVLYSQKAPAKLKQNAMRVRIKEPVGHLASLIDSSSRICWSVASSGILIGLEPQKLLLEMLRPKLMQYTLQISTALKLSQF